MLLNPFVKITTLFHGLSESYRLQGFLTPGIERPTREPPGQKFPCCSNISYHVVHHHSNLAAQRLFRCACQILCTGDRDMGMVGGDECGRLLAVFHRQEMVLYQWSRV